MIPPTTRSDPTPDPSPNPDVAVPPDEAPAARCPYCDRPFSRERARALHLGEVHPDACTAKETDAYEAALADERDELFYFHMKAIAALGSIYAVTVVLYMVALGSGIL